MRQRSNEGYLKKESQMTEKRQLRNITNSNVQMTKKPLKKDKTKIKMDKHQNKPIKQIAYSESEQDESSYTYKQSNQRSNSIQYLQSQNSILKQQVDLLNRELIKQKDITSKLNSFILQKNLENTLLHKQIHQLHSKIKNNRQATLHLQDQQQQDQTFQEIKKLKLMVNQLRKQNHQLFLNSSSTEREEIKDRIIIKLEDQIITLNLLLKQQKQIASKKLKSQQNYGNSIKEQLILVNEFETTLKDMKVDLIDLTDNLCWQDTCEVLSPTGYSVYVDENHYGKLYTRHWISAVDHLVQF